MPASNGFAAPAEPPRQRRARYTGKYPQNFEEKHKEQAGDAATIARVLLKGGTPAGSHVPIMATECLAHLGLVEGSTEITTAAPSLGGASEMVAVDCTLGFGGHSGLMLDALSEWAASNDARRAALASFDRDGVELAKTEARLRARPSLNSDSSAAGLRLHCINASFATIGSAFAEREIPAAHALLADLGCSSMQIDDPARGFTWKADGPLDMRMDTTASSASPADSAAMVTGAAMTAAELLLASNVSSLAALLRANSDFETADARALALSVLAEPRPTTTSELASRIRSVKPPPAPEVEASAAMASGGKGGGSGGGGDGKSGGRGGGGGKSGGRGGGGKGGGGKGDMVRQRDGGYKAVEHSKRLRSMGMKKLLRALEEEEEEAESRGPGGGGSGGGSGGRKPKHLQPDEAEKQLNSRVARVMQALRIEVNDEFAALNALLASLPSVLAPSGRAVFLTFHSGEDRRVKQAMKDGLKSGVYSEISRRVVRVGREEARANPRSKCCKLRWCVRAAD